MNRCCKISKHLAVVLSFFLLHINILSLNLRPNKMMLQQTSFQICLTFSNGFCFKLLTEKRCETIFPYFHSQYQKLSKIRKKISLIMRQIAYSSTNIIKRAHSFFDQSSSSHVVACCVNSLTSLRTFLIWLASSFTNKHTYTQLIKSPNVIILINYSYHDRLTGCFCAHLNAPVRLT